MQFLIDVREIANGWEVRGLDPATGAPIVDPRTHQPILQQPRRLRRVGQGAEVFPLPPQADVDALPANAPHRDLCAAADEIILSDAYAGVLNQQAGPQGVARFGRYLFTTLLGADVWNAVDAAAGAEPIELALCLPDDDRALSCLPWEAMHFGADAAQGPWQGFLAAEPQVAITRRVAGAAHPVNDIASPPRVLFVVGASLADDVIRPGAEYLGLLQSLNYEGLYLKKHLLLQASTVKLEEVIKWFRPTVLHFICHGVVSEGRACLQMRHKDAQVKPPVAVNADALKQALQTSENLPLPQIVVLSACSTATADELTTGRPFAAELVRLGVPIVVGMSGRVADQACRLFTTGFYKALLKGGEIAQAAAEGRRAAIRHGGYDPANNVDWALPTLFLSTGVVEARLTVQPQADEVERQRLAQDYAPPPFPTFCNRLEIIETYNLLMADDPVQKSAAKEMQVMAVSVKQPEGDDPLILRPRYGRTWLLKELAAQAILDGHVPCLVTKDLVGGGDWPKTLKDLLRPVMMQAVNLTVQRLSTTAQHAGLAWTWNYLPRILNLLAGDPLPPDCPIEIRRSYDANPNDLTDTLAAAFRLDLLDLLKAVRAQRPDAERSRVRLLLLIDDVHQMGEVAGKLLNNLLGPLVRTAAKDARAVFTYSEVPATGQGPAVKAVTDWVKSPWVELVTLGKFHRKDEKEYTAYKQFLLRWKDQGQDRPLALARSERDPFVQNFLNQLAASVEGIPSNLEPKGSPVIRTFFGIAADPNIMLPNFKVLRAADDEDALKAVEQLRRE